MHQFPRPGFPSGTPTPGGGAMLNSGEMATLRHQVTTGQMDAMAARKGVNELKEQVSSLKATIDGLQEEMKRKDAMIAVLCRHVGLSPLDMDMMVDAIMNPPLPPTTITAPNDGNSTDKDGPLGPGEEQAAMERPTTPPAVPSNPLLAQYASFTELDARYLMPLEAEERASEHSSYAAFIVSTMESGKLEEGSGALGTYTYMPVQAPQVEVPVDAGESSDDVYGSLPIGEEQYGDFLGAQLIDMPQIPSAVPSEIPSGVSSDESETTESTTGGAAGTGVRDWNAEWQASWQRVLTTASDRVEHYIRLFRLQREFQEACETTVRMVVDDLLLPPAHRRLSAVDAGGIAGGEKYIHNGIFYKFARDWKGIYGGDEYAMKSASLEFGNMKVLLDAQLALNVQPDALLRVPLAVLVDYCGYRLLALSQLPIAKDTLVYGSADAGRSVSTKDPEVNSLMEALCTSLNLEPHAISDGDRTVQLACCADIEVHRGRDKSPYIVDTARIFPPEAPPSNLTAFLLAARKDQKKLDDRMGASTVTRVDINRSRAVLEISSILGAVSATDQHNDSSIRRSVKRIPVPGATMFLRTDLNPQLLDNSVIEVGAARYAQLASTNGVNHTASSILDAFAVGRGCFKGVQVPIYGDVILVVGERGQHLYNCLRPEHVLNAPHSISSDVYSAFGKVNAAEHNAHCKAATRLLLEQNLVKLAKDVRSGQLIVSSVGSFLNELHRRGVNVRFFGVLRALLVEHPSKNQRENMLPLRVRSVRSVLLTQMVVRVVKQLLRYVLRHVSEIAASWPLEAPARQGLRKRVLAWCSDIILAPSGAWATDEHVELAVGQKSAADLFWSTVLRCFLELKFSTQAPALTGEERSFACDLRGLLDRSHLMVAINEQLGISMSRGRSGTPLESDTVSAIAHAANRHPHDPLILPRMARRSKQDRPREHADRPEPAEQICSSTWFYTRRAPTEDAKTEDVEPFAKLAFASRWPSMDPAEILDNTPRDVKRASLPAALETAYNLADAFGVDYMYTMPTLPYAIDDCGNSWANVTYLQSLGNFSAHFNGCRLDPNVTKPIMPSKTKHDPDDINDLLAVCKGLLSEDGLFEAIRLHPEALGPAGMLRLARVQLTASYFMFDALRCSSNVRLLSSRGSPVDCKLDRPAAKISASDFMSSIILNPLDSVRFESRSKGFDFALSSAAFCVETASADEYISWTVNLQPGYDMSGFHVGVSTYPFLIVDDVPSKGWWSFCVSPPHFLWNGTRIDAALPPEFAPSYGSGCTVGVRVNQRSGHVVFSVNCQPVRAALPALPLESISVARPDDARPVTLENVFYPVVGLIGKEDNRGAIIHATLGNLTGGNFTLSCGPVTTPGRLMMKAASPVALATLVQPSIFSKHSAVSDEYLELLGGFDDPLVEICSWDSVDGAKYAYQQCVEAFGEHDRRTTKCCLKVGKQYLDRGDVPSCTAWAEKAFANQVGTTSGRFSLSEVVRAYMLLGDACLQADADLMVRANAAEQWYARAWNVVASAFPDARALHITDEMLHACTSTVTSHVDDSSRSIASSLEPRLSTQAMLAYPPFVILILNKLVAALRVQDRLHHAYSIVHVSLQMHLLYGCPVDPGRFCASFSEWMTSTSVGVSPICKVYDSFLTQADVARQENPYHFSPLGFHDTAYADKYPTFIDGGKHRHVIVPSVTHIHQWVVSITTHADMGVSRDVNICDCLGVQQFGPDPRCLSSWSIPTCLQTQGGLVSRHADLTGGAGSSGTEHDVFVWGVSEMEMRLLAIPATEQVDSADDPAPSASLQFHGTVPARHPTTNPHLMLNNCIDFKPSGAENTLTVVSGRAMVFSSSHSETAYLKYGVTTDAEVRLPTWRLYPIRPLQGKVITALAAGGSFAIFVDAFGAVYSVGSNDFGELGHGDFMGRDTPQVVKSLDSVKVTNVVVGKEHALVVGTEAASTCMYAWGRNSSGCCGVGHSRKLNLPTLVFRSTELSVSSLSASDEMSAFTTSVGDIMVMGNFTWTNACKTPLTFDYPTLLVPDRDTLMQPVDTAMRSSAQMGLNGWFNDQSSGWELVRPLRPGTAHRECFVQCLLVRDGIFGITSDGRQFSQVAFALVGDGLPKNGRGRSRFMRNPSLGPAYHVPPEHAFANALSKRSFRASQLHCSDNEMLCVGFEESVHSRKSLCILSWGRISGVHSRDLESVAVSPSRLRSIDTGSVSCLSQKVPAFSDVSAWVQPRICRLSSDLWAMLPGLKPHADVVTSGQLASSYVTMRIIPSVAQPTETVKVAWSHTLPTLSTSASLSIQITVGDTTWRTFPVNTPTGDVDFPAPLGIGQYSINFVDETWGTGMRRILQQTELNVSLETPSSVEQPALQLIVPFPRARIHTALCFIAIAETSFLRLPWSPADLLSLVPSGCLRETREKLHGSLPQWQTEPAFRTFTAARMLKEPASSADAGQSATTDADVECPDSEAKDMLECDSDCRAPARHQQLIVLRGQQVTSMKEGMWSLQYVCPSVRAYGGARLASRQSMQPLQVDRDQATWFYSCEISAKAQHLKVAPGGTVDVTFSICGGDVDVTQCFFAWCSEESLDMAKAAVVADTLRRLSAVPPFDAYPPILQKRIAQSSADGNFIIPAVHWVANLNDVLTVECMSAAGVVPVSDTGASRKFVAAAPPVPGRHCMVLGIPADAGAVALGYSHAVKVVEADKLIPLSQRLAARKEARNAEKTSRN